MGTWPIDHADDKGLFDLGWAGVGVEPEGRCRGQPEVRNHHNYSPDIRLLNLISRQ